MADFQNLDIRIRAIDEASATLDKVSRQLEKIKSLTAMTSTTTSGTSAKNYNQQAASIRNLTSSIRENSSEITSLTNKQLTLQNSTLSLSNAERNYTIAVNNRINAEKSLESAELSLYNAQNQRAIIQNKLNTTTNEQTRINLLRQLENAERNVTIAENNFAKAQNNVVNATNREISALANLQKAQNNTTKSSNNLYLAQQRQLNQNTKTINSFALMAGKFYTVYRIIRRITRALFSTIQESAQFVENLNLFAVTFGDAYEETLDWALDFADSLGVASNEIVRFTGLFKQLADSIGIASDVGTEMSQVLTQLGYDLASFYNITTESAFEKLQAGIFSGQTKPLRSLGLDVTQQTLDNLLKTNEAFKDLGVTSSKALLQADKAMLRLIVVLQNAQNSFGDINRTINTTSNQLRVFESSISNLKLAIGDLLNESFNDALIKINGFIMGITKVIRAIHPLNTEAETAGAGMQQFADDTEEAIDKMTSGGNLDFDKFRVLGDSDSQISITQAITEELERQIAAYKEQVAAMDEVENKAITISEAVKDWFIITDDEGKFVDWTQQAKDLSDAMQALVFVFGGTFGRIIALNKIFYDLYQTDEQFKQSVIELKNQALALLPQLLSAIISAIKVIIPLIQQILPIIVNIASAVADFISYLSELGVLDDMILGIVLAFAALKALQLIAFFASLTKSIFSLTIALGALSAIITFTSFKSLIDDANQLGKILYTLLAALIAAAAGFAAVKIAQAGLGAPAVAAAIGIAMGAGIAAIYGQAQLIQGFANGGITDANLIMTHENGVREWVGRQGNSTAVVNDTQMSDVMGTAVRNGVLEAMSYNTGNGETFNITVQANLDGQKVYESTKRIARRNGEKFARV